MNIFNKKITLNYGVEHITQFENFKKHVMLDYDIINAYYKDRETNLKNHNLLVRIIKQLYVDIDIDDLDYLERVSDSLEQVMRKFNIMTEYSKGTVFTSLFGDSVMLFQKEFINPFSVNDDTSVMKCLYSSSQDLYMNHPYYIKDGHYVFMVDFIALMMQYKKWAEPRFLIGDHIMPTLFVYQVLYTNMIKDIFDFSIVNRFFDIDLVESKSYHPFVVRDYDNRVDEMMTELYNKISGRKMYYPEAFSWIPVPFSNNAFELLRRDYFADNSNTKIFNFITTSIMFNNIVYLLKDNGIKQNSDLLTHYFIFFMDLEKNKYVEHFDFKNPKLYLLMNKVFKETKEISILRKIK